MNRQKRRATPPPTPEQLAVADRIRKAREAAGYTTQKAFADAVGVYLPNVNKWEKGKALPSTRNLETIHSLTGVTAEEILSGARSSSIGGGEAVRTESLRAFYDSDAGKTLSSRQKYALAELLEGIEVDEWRLRGALQLLELLEETGRPKASGE